MGRVHGGKLDAVMTPPPAAWACCKYLAEQGIMQPRRIIEPHVGSGAFIAPIRHYWPAARVLGIDVRPDAAGLQLVDRARVGRLSNNLPTYKPRTLALGNPPFSDAQNQIELALTFADDVVFLLPADIVFRRPWAAFWQRHSALTTKLDQRPFQCCREVALYHFRREWQQQKAHCVTVSPVSIHWRRLAA